MAQTEEEVQSKIPLSLSYYGNTAVYTGFKLSADYIWLEIQKTKEKKSGKVKRISKGLYTTPFLSFYRQPRSHASLQLGGDLIWRRTNSIGWFREVGLGLGYLRRYNVGKTYEVQSDGAIKEKSLASYGYFFQSFSLATGKKINLQNYSSITPFIRWNIDFINGYNSTGLLSTSLEVGGRFILPFNPNRGDYSIIKKTKKK